MNHYTNKRGFQGISAAPDWLFKANQPPGQHPFGAYFTTLPPGTKRLAARLRIPREKLQYIFTFGGDEGLEPLEGGRGKYVFLSRVDYTVTRSRQVPPSGPTGL